MVISILFVVALFAAAAVALGLAVVAGRRASAPGRGPFVVLMVGVGVWTVSYGLHMLFGDQAVKVFFLNLQYVGVFLATGAYFAFAFEYTRLAWLPRWAWGGLAVEPLLVGAAIWTTGGHGLFHDVVEIVPVGALTVVNVALGPVFWVHVAYSYVVLMSGFVLLVQAFLRSPELYRGQILWFVAGSLAPFVANVINVLKLLPVPVDITSVFFLIMGLCMGYSLFRFRLLDVVPVARGMVFESMHDAVVVMDVQNRVVDLNPAAQRLFAGDDSPIGRSLGDLFVARYGAIGRYANRETYTEVTVGEGEGQQVFDLRISAVQRGGQPAGRLVVLRDITARRRVEEERERLIAELDAYAHTVAHDLKNPVYTIYGYAEFIKDGFAQALPDEAIVYLGRILDAGSRMAGIIDALLMLARVRSQQRVEMAPLEMGQVVEWALERLLLMGEQARAVFVLPEGWPVALGYAPWVEEVWVNYISNAIKYGGEPPAVEMGADVQDDGMVRFWVRDNGHGISEDQQESLFVEFTRLDSHAQQEGHGLGLSIVRRIVERLGGEVGVESESGRGSRFYFTLRVAEEAE